ncbi:MAG: tRNA preQ1(34) S-adenosylmethionine ribosyltransferase-isomerase QueA [Phycisphaerae bacterium]|nr:tRNA preQ1(34) S-adenosylmethionine ribosyltransferase-isomerase QueA [Phycisphaerae bacterium]MCZ2401476.1 tRNA preQ1(34) S-adenosylmethionine ribosyltransferase-isomerase QueA [Phycisphaerae bacterium]
MPQPERQSFPAAQLAYELPAERIAQHPAEPRDASRLLVLDRATGDITHTVFGRIGDWLRPGDCLVLNNTRVLPARFFCRRSTGGRVEALFLHADDAGWRVLLRPAARLRADERLACEGAPDRGLLLRERGERGVWTVAPEPPEPPETLLARIGQTPLPPYIRREGAPPAPDAARYQTVYARHAGAVAAPTAGLHFTPELLARLRAQGVATAEVTLHVGMGTFAPIEVADLRDHRMHAEWFECPAAALERIAAARAAGGRIVAVGTTSARVLESPADPGAAPVAGETRRGWTDIFIYPPYEFRQLDALLTNFHLPGSTLLALVMALGGVEPVRRAYAEAIAHEYRFYSYGDAMLLI